MEDLSTKAYVLRTRAFGESDLIVVLLTEKLGKISGIAKGARRSKKRFAGGALEPFQPLTIRLTRKPHASLAFLHDSRVMSNNARIAADVEAFAWAAYLTELTEFMTVERDPCPELFDLYADIVAALGDGVDDSLAHHFILGLLDQAGWGPDLEACGICAESIGEYSSPILDHRGSGVICSRHEAEQQGFAPDDARFRPSRRIINPELMDYVRLTRAAPVANAPTETVRLATALLDRLVDLHLVRPPKSRAFLAELRRGALADPPQQVQEKP